MAKQKQNKSELQSDPFLRKRQRQIDRRYLDPNARELGVRDRKIRRIGGRIGIATLRMVEMHRDPDTRESLTARRLSKFIIPEILMSRTQLANVLLVNNVQDLIDPLIIRRTGLSEAIKLCAHTGGLVSKYVLDAELGDATDYDREMLAKKAIPELHAAGVGLVYRYALGDPTAFHAARLDGIETDI